MLWGFAACNRAESIDECTPKIARMRKDVAMAYDGSEAPAHVAPWVKELYLEVQSTRDATVRAAKISDGIARTIGGCYGIADAFRAAANAPAGARRAAMAREVPDALQMCQCRGVDVDSLSFLLRVSPAP